MELAAEPRPAWLDVTSRDDYLCFAGVDPYRSCGLQLPQGAPYPELRLIDLEFSQREDAAMREYNDATHAGDQVAQDIARAKLARIQELKQLAEEEAALQNQSPLQKLRDELNQSAGQIGESLEQVAVDGFGALIGNAPDDRGR